MFHCGDTEGGRGGVREREREGQREVGREGGRTEEREREGEGGASTEEGTAYWVH